MEWMAYEAIEPFGEIRAEQRNGLTCSVIANVNRDSKVKPEPFSHSDFMFHTKSEPEKKLTPEEIESHLDNLYR